MGRLKALAAGARLRYVSRKIMDQNIPSSTSAPTDSQTPTETKVERFRVVRRLFRAEVYYSAALAGFAVLTAFVYFNAYFGWDLRAALALQSVGNLYGFMGFVSKAGDSWTPFALTGATALVFLLFRKKSEAAGIIFSAAGSALIARFIKVAVARPRPPADLVTVLTEGDLLSFPSGHVTFYVTYFGFLFFVAFANLPRGSFARVLSMLLTALPVVLIGFSRVYLGRHWPSDALGAYLMGGLWLAVSLRLYRHWKARGSRVIAES